MSNSLHDRELKVLFASKILDIGPSAGGKYWSVLNLFKALEKKDLNINLLHSNQWQSFSSKENEVVLPNNWQNDVLKAFQRLINGPRLLQEFRPDILHFDDASFVHTALSLTFPREVKKIATITDITPLIYPSHYPFSFKAFLSTFIEFSKNHCDKIITKSKSSADDINNTFGIPHEKISVVYEGIEKPFRQISLKEANNFVKNEYNLEGGYILYSGGTDPNKNFGRLLKGYLFLKRNYEGIPPLVTTGYGVKEYIENFLSKSKWKKYGIRCLGYVPRSHLPLIFKGAKIFVFPSLHEGFGRPPVEAMSCKTPVIASDISVFRETLGDAALLIDSTNPENIANGILKLNNDNNLRSILKKRGFERAKKYTWEKSARKVTRIYRTLKD